MRILMINDHLQFGGGGDAVFRLERTAYEEAGHEVYTFSQAPSFVKEATPRDIVCIEYKDTLRTKVGKFLGAPYIGKALQKLIAQTKPHLIRVHLVSKYPMDIYPQLAGYPVIQTLHGPNLFCATSWGNLMKDGRDCELGIGVKCWQRGCTSFSAAMLYTLLDARVRPVVKKVVHLYHCPSRQIKDKADSLGYRPTIHLPLGVDQGFMEAEPTAHLGPPVVLYVGGLIDAKGVMYLPDALQRMQQAIPDIKLWICGQGPMLGALQKEFLSRGLMKNVEFKGFVDRSQIIDLYRFAHVLLCPSIYSEQFGLVGPEALACGVPCVGSRVGGIPEWLHDGEFGFLVPPRDAESLAKKTLLLLQDRSMRLQMGAQGRAFVRKTHDPVVYQKRWLELALQYAFAI